jgi:N-acetylglucosaminyl-diphospho-decaprenol L-rhamnosyltransferase
MSDEASVVVATVNGGARLERLLTSLDEQTLRPEVIVVANGSRPDALKRAVRKFRDVDFVELPQNVGFSKAVNLGARRAGGRALVLVNDDCVCEPQFVAHLSSALDARRSVVMAAGVLLEARNPSTIDTAGMELDETLLVFDYLNGEPISILDRAVADPIGPSGAAAAFDRDAFLSIGGFDEALFAYWEDVDLVLRLRRAGATCVLAHSARGLHEHSSTLGSGSSEKNRLAGFGRGYVLRKWGVLNAPSRIPKTLAREVAISTAQLLVDGTASGLRGRIAGYAAARSAHPEAYPTAFVASRDGLGRTLARRLRRRLRLGS